MHKTMWILIYIVFFCRVSPGLPVVHLCIVGSGSFLTASSVNSIRNLKVNLVELEFFKYHLKTDVQSLCLERRAEIACRDKT